MAPKGAMDSLVERLAEAEQLLVNDTGGSSSGGNSSAVASEERESIVEATAIIEDLERSSNIDSRSEVGSDGSGLHHQRRTGTADSIRSSSVSGDSLADRHAASQADEEDPSPSNPQSLLIWRRLKDSQAAKEEVSSELKVAEEAMEKLKAAKSKELDKMRQKLDDAQLDAAKNLLIQKRHLNREKSVLKQQLLALKAQEEGAIDEKEVMAMRVASMQASHAKEIANLKGARDPSLSDADHDKNMRLELSMSHIANREMASELTELRMKILDNEKVRQHEVTDLKMMLDAANFREEMQEQGMSASSSSSGTRVLSMVSGIRRKSSQPQSTSASMTGQLDAIEEDPDDVDSLAASSGTANFNVSSVEDEEVIGDLRDVDDDDIFDMVMKQNDKSKKDIKELEDAALLQKSELASREAASELSIQHLKEHLALSEKNHAITTKKLEALQKLFRNREAEEMAPHLEAVQPGGSSEADAEMQDTENARLKQQVDALKEANRVAYARIEDLKHALATVGRNHKNELEEMRQKLLRNTGSDHDFSMGGSDLESLRDRLKNSEEEKNVMANAMEWKEIQWKTKVETVQLEMEEQKRKQETQVSRLELHIAELEATAKRALEAQSVPQPIPPAALEGQPATLLGLFRCPMRGGAGADGLKPVFSQEVTWRVVNEIKGSVALLCCMRDCIIEQSTREANRIWGSALLNGKSLFSLAHGPSSQQWLKKAVVGQQRMADVGRGGRGPAGFLIRDLGCEAFTSRKGEMFDASVTVAHFPAEPACGKPPALLIILEPQMQPRYSGAVQPPDLASSSAPSSQSRGGGDRRGTRSSRSDVSLSSVSPSDSASNVLGIHGW